MIHSIIGFGISGMILFLELMESNTDPASICLFDPNWLGGDLVLKYGSVISNTPWSKTRTVLSKYEFAKTTIEKGDSVYKLDDLMLVSDMALYLLMACRPFLKNVKRISYAVKTICESETGWIIKGGFEPIVSKNVYLCLGSEPKTMNLNNPIIPLEIGLDIERLKKFVYPEMRVAVIGCSHSGLIIMRNLQTLGVNVRGFYKGSQPFYYARDGVYNGIKGGIVEFADLVKNGLCENVKLVCWSESSVLECESIFIATGFVRRPIDITLLDGSHINGDSYDSNTGVIQSRKGLYGVGIAYPGTTQIGSVVYEDVGLLLFQEQICRIFDKN